MPKIDLQPYLKGDRISLRPLRASDFEALYAAASAPETWAGHPAKDRHKREVFEKYFTFLLENGGTLVVIDNEQDRIIGCSRYYYAPILPDNISIGFTFLNHAYWGGGTNFAMKKLMLDHAFTETGEVWFHIDPSNIRSQKATAKLGAHHVSSETIDLSGAAAKWMCFRLSKGDWNAIVESRGQPA